MYEFFAKEKAAKYRVIYGLSELIIARNLCATGTVRRSHLLIAGSSDNSAQTQCSSVPGCFSNSPMESAGDSLHFGSSASLGSHETQPSEDDMRVEARQLERRASVSSEESDVEAPPVIVRKVSFADAFGLDLVSVKEFDTWNTPTPAASSPSDHSSLQDCEESCLSRLFAVPSSPEELRRTLQAQKIQLEHVELLPGTTSLRGTIRVLNLSFDKQVYARTTLDKWDSQFDLLAEFVPGSSDGETDRFSFMLSLMSPSEGQRIRVEFCLRYETAMGTFWDNNSGRNYVLFYDKRTARDMKVRVQEELFQPNKKSCLKASRWAFWGHPVSLTSILCVLTY